MTLRAGYYDAAKPDWRGIIRQDSYGWYRCWGHNHQTSREATKCARDALPGIKALGEGDELPLHWEVIPRGD
jgi:hypothetical protein